MLEHQYDYPRVFEDSDAMKSFYDSNGYVSLKNGLPQDDLRSIANDLTEIFAPYATDASNLFDSAVIELDRTNKEKLHELHIVASRLSSIWKISSVVSEFIDQIYGKKRPQMIIDNAFMLGIPKDSRLVYDFHQESNYMKDFDDILNVHYPIFRTSNFENGTMSVLPGTHKLGTLDYEKSRSAKNSYTNLIPAGIDQITETNKELFNYLDVGDVLIFHKDLIHKSNYNSS